MALLKRALVTIRQPQVDRPPVGGTTLSSMLQSSVPGGGHLAYLNAYGSVGWLFATVSRISEAVASVRWDLFDVRGEEPKKVERHDLLDLWNSVNPFFTREEFVETFQQHLDLVGEAYWLLLRSGDTGPIHEIWSLRPDRIRPIPDRQEYLKGYIYQVGGEKVPLRREDVVFLRRPNPLDPYRGMGPVQAILSDLDSEKFSSQWNRNFFLNSAQPGGIIEYPENLGDEDFERAIMRWRAQHQGVANAHRVAILEKGKWIDRKFSMRDMQFRDLRMINRDIILGAFGMPQHLLGIAENVNRANAEAAEVMFARWIVKPRLQRIKASLNERVAPLFGEGLEFDFVDPVPADRELDLKEAEVGAKTSTLSVNEVRRRLGEGAREGGDAPAFMASAREPGPIQKAVEKRPQEIDDLEGRMEKAWGHRLEEERDRIVAALTGGARAWGRSKLTPDDVDKLDWDWWVRHGVAVTEELTAGFQAALTSELPPVAPSVAQQLAQDYAERRGAALLRLDGDANLVNLTRERVRQHVAQTIAEGESLNTLKKRLREDFGFSKVRAERIARTETATAMGQGVKAGAKLQGKEEKHWWTQGDERVTPECASNEEAEWIAIDDAFPSGVDTIPQHVNCFPGSVRVLARGVEATMARWYDGQLVTLKTALGKELSCTPNHPILTPCGWVPAGQLTEGSYVICSNAREWEFGVDLYDNDIPAPIDHVVETLSMALPSLARPVKIAPEDFHGDGVDSEIAIIWTNRLLRGNGNALLPKGSAQFNLRARHSRAVPSPSFARSGALQAFGLGSLPSTARSIGGSRYSAAVGETHRRVLTNLGFLSTARCDATAEQRSPDAIAVNTKQRGRSILGVPVQVEHDHAPFGQRHLEPAFGPSSQNSRSFGDAVDELGIDIKLARNILAGASGLILLDRIVLIERRPFSGHVYNLQTKSGAYLAEGIVAHNCRCDVSYRQIPLAPAGAALEVRCPDCGKLLAKGVDNANLYCPRCKLEVQVVGGIAAKPFPNEHSCRLRSPADFQPDSFRRTSRRHGGKIYHVIMGRLHGQTTMTEQAYRYPKDIWSTADARKHCKDHDGQRFEPATGKSAGEKGCC